MGRPRKEKEQLRQIEVSMLRDQEVLFEQEELKENKEEEEVYEEKVVYKEISDFISEDYLRALKFLSIVLLKCLVAGFISSTLFFQCYNCWSEQNLIFLTDKILDENPELYFFCFNEYELRAYSIFIVVLSLLWSIFEVDILPKLNTTIDFKEERFTKSSYGAICYNIACLVYILLFSFITLENEMFSLSFYKIIIAHSIPWIFLICILEMIFSIISKFYEMKREYFSLKKTIKVKKTF